MDRVAFIREKAGKNQKLIALPEYKDKRVIDAVRIIESEKIAKVLFLTPDRMDPTEKDRYIGEFYEARKAKGVTLEQVKEMFRDPLWYAAMLCRDGKVDGYVAGASHTTADMVRSAIYCVGIDPRFTIASSCFFMIVPDPAYGEEGTFIFADCAVIPDPNPRQLSCIAVAAAELSAKVLGVDSRIAFLSYSTHGSAQGKSIEKVQAAVQEMKNIAPPGMLYDGEMQVDAAIVPAVADIKFPNSPIHGRANVLIFPNLEAGNIAYKIVERLAHARAIGPLLMGIKRPCSDLSRGCSAEDVADCVAVTAIRAA
ncbi:MAG: phosphate acyltransferase [Deltaproteobacteria bacterium]